MLALMLLVEGLVVCFIVLLACVVGIQNGAQGLIFLYEKDVQERAIANGLITREKIVSNGKKFKIWGIGSMIVFLLIAAYGLNGARGFKALYPQKDNDQEVGGQHDRLSDFGSDPVRYYVTVCEIKGIEKRGIANEGKRISEESVHWMDRRIFHVAG